MSKAVILFCCHFWSPDIEHEFSRLKKCCDKDFDVVLSYDCSKEPDRSPKDLSNHLFTADHIRKMGYSFQAEEGIWYHVEYPILDYYMQNPQYDFYWRIEYDVRFGGDWCTFFRYFIDNHADLLATYTKTYKDEPTWYWWNKINLEVDKNCLRGIFFPVVRFSRRSLELLDHQYRNGAWGHCEAIVPTLLNMEKMIIEDIGKRFYDLFTFNYNGIVIRKKSKLHHPVKDMKFSERLMNAFNILRNPKNILKKTQ
jgi:hypothetical protein